MAVQGVSQRPAVTRPAPDHRKGLAGRVFILVAACLLAASASLAVALVALTRPEASVPAPRAAAESALRQQRIEFFEERIRNDPIDTTALNVLTGEYLQRARETGDVADYERAAYASERVLAVVPNDYAGLVQSAQANLAQHNFLRAIEL